MPGGRHPVRSVHAALNSKLEPGPCAYLLDWLAPGEQILGKNLGPALTYFTDSCLEPLVAEGIHKGLRKRLPLPPALILAPYPQSCFQTEASDQPVRVIEPGTPILDVHFL